MFNCDWFSFSVLLSDDEPTVCCPDGFRVELYPGNNIYKNRLMLFDEVGEKYLTVLWSPYSSLLDKHISSVQFANHWLYEVGGIQKCMSLLHQIFECQFNSISRVDLCCDFQPSDSQMAVIRQLQFGDCYVQGKSEGSIFWHSSYFKDRLQQNAHCLSWGSKSSEIKVKLYNKSREQGMELPTSLAEKPWIVDEWREAEFDVTKVWRLEFSIMSISQLRFDDEPLSLSMFTSWIWRVRTFVTLYSSRFIIRENRFGRKGHKNADPIVSFLRMPERLLGMRWKKYTAAEDKLPVITLIRKLLVLAESDACQASLQSFNEVAGSIVNLTVAHRLDGYFVRRFGVGCVQYLDRMAQKVGGGVVEVDAKPSREWL